MIGRGDKLKHVRACGRYALTAWLCCILNVLYAGEAIRFNRLDTSDGLSENVVEAILQCSQGFMWFATAGGLNRFDGYTVKTYPTNVLDETGLGGTKGVFLHEDRNGYLWIGLFEAGLDRLDLRTGKFTHYRHDPDNPRSLPSDRPTCLYEDPRGFFWIGFQDQGLAKFDPNTGEVVQFIIDPDNRDNISANNIRDILPDTHGHLMLATFDGLVHFEQSTGEIEIYRHNPEDPQSISHNRVQHMALDRDGNLWVGTQKGLNRYDERTRTFQRFMHDPEQEESISGDDITSLHVDRHGVLWVGDRDAGLNRMTHSSGRFDHYRHDPGDPASISIDDILTITEDRQGILWIGTYAGGVSYYNRAQRMFRHYRRNIAAQNTLSDNIITSFSEDPEGNLWFGTTQGFNRYDPLENRFTQFLRDESSSNTLGNEYVHDLDFDADGMLWLGTRRGGLNRFDPKTGQYLQFNHDPEDPESIAYDSILAVTASEKALWLGIDGRGLDRFDLETYKTRHYPLDQQGLQSIGGGFVFSIMEDRDGELWLGTVGSGLVHFNPETERLTGYAHDPQNPDSIPANTVYTTHQDRHGDIWAGTDKGLCRLREDGFFDCFDEDTGLPTSSIQGIMEDRRGNLWLTTNKGIVKFDPDTQQAQGYGVQHGLQHNEFYSKSFIHHSSGAMYAGGLNGFNTFFPDLIKLNPHPPEVVITDLLFYNKSVALQREDPESPLEVPVTYTDRIDLTYKTYVFGFEFAGLHFAAPENNQYAYMMDGLNDQWIETAADKRFATYTKLSPGHYTFRVKAANSDGLWSDQEATIKVYIAPPPWRTVWAYMVYTLALLGLIAFYLVRHQRQLKEERLAREREQEINRRLTQVDRLKDEFLANTSHELRTPLNGIIGLAESLNAGVAGALSDKARYNLDMIIASGRRLSSLVNDILDFSKIKNDSLELRIRPVDLHATIDVVLTLSRPLIDRRPLELINNTPANLPAVSADEDRLLQIFHNLIGNAIKFTQSGEIAVSAEAREDRVYVTVSDTGIGISPDKLQSIFDPFDQVDGSTERDHGGAGLGLAITRQLVEHHQGRISVTSTLGEGSIFTFYLPISGTAPRVDEPIESQVGATMSVNQLALPDSDNRPLVTPLPFDLIRPVKGDYHILVVDDEPINRQVLVDHLSMCRYRITEAAGGAEALHLLDQDSFDMVLLDVMMPRISGYEVCRRIRERFSVQALPVIFLTAKNQAGDILTGFANGANDYITKPIEQGELHYRVKTHLEILSFNRELEGKVAERTAELRKQNMDLETLDRIVQAINREVDLISVIQTLLEQGMSLFPKAETSAFLLRERGWITQKESADPDSFRFVAAVGYTPDQIKDYVFSEQEALQRYAGGDGKDDVYIKLDFTNQNHADQLGDLRLPQAIIVMAIRVEGHLEALLILENFVDPGVFRESDRKKLARFREHTVSALSKARMVRDLSETRRQLLAAAHQAGMAEIAGNVLHSLGNELNSAQTSIHLIAESNERKWLQLLEKINQNLHEHAEDLTSYLAKDQKGDKIATALDRIHANLERSHERVQAEALTLTERLQNMAGVLRQQHQFTEVDPQNVEPSDLNLILSEALKIVEENDEIDVIRNLSPISPSLLDPVKITRILIYLLKNAAEAIQQRADHQDRGRIEIVTEMAQDEVQLHIKDNGVGIRKDDLTRVFTQGFTTKKPQQGTAGFGLHYCANAVKEMNGHIEINSDGANQGAQVTLSFPATSIPEFAFQN